jgi:hypothetical protein
LGMALVWASMYVAWRECSLMRTRAPGVATALCDADSPLAKSFLNNNLE